MTPSQRSPFLRESLTTWSSTFPILILKSQTTFNCHNVQIFQDDVPVIAPIVAVPWLAVLCPNSARRSWHRYVRACREGESRSLIPTKAAIVKKSGRYFWTKDIKNQCQKVLEMVVSKKSKNKVHPSHPTSHQNTLKTFKNCASNLPSCRNPPDVFWDAEGIEEAGDLGESMGDFHSGGTPIGGGTPH